MSPERTASSGAYRGLAIACWWLAAVVSALSLAGVAVALTAPRQIAPGSGALDIVLGWAFVGGCLALAALGLGRLASRT